MGKHEKYLKCFEKEIKKNSVYGLEKKNCRLNTRIGLWFWFPTPKPGYGCTLI
jgi:hypothetical protein